MLKRTASVLAFLAAMTIFPAFAGEIAVKYAQQPSAKGTYLTAYGATDAPDETLVTLTLTVKRLTLNGEQSKLVSLMRAPVKQGQYVARFGPYEDGLDWGEYTLNVKVDPNRQRREVIADLKKLGEFQGEAQFEVKFTGDIFPRCKELIGGMSLGRNLHQTLVEKFNQVKDQNLGPEELKKYWEGWKPAWDAKRTEIFTDPPGKEDLLYPDTSNYVRGLVEKLSLWERKYWADLSGEKDPTIEAHPNWLEPPVPEHLEQTSGLLVRETMLNSLRKVNYVWEKLKEQGNAPLPGREGARLSPMVEDIRKCVEMLAADPLTQKEMKAFTDAATKVAIALQDWIRAATDGALDDDARAKLDQQVVTSFRTIYGKVNQK